MDLKKAQEYIKALKNGEKFPKKNMFLIMFLLGALLFVIVLPTGSSAPTSEKGGLDENKRKENKNSQTGEYETYIEEKTSSVLSRVKSNGQKLIEKDHSGSTQTQEETSDGNVRKDSESTSEKISVYEQTADGASVPYVSKELTPEVEGVIVIADGGGDAVVARNLTEAVQALFGVEAHKIKIMKRG